MKRKRWTLALSGLAALLLWWAWDKPEPTGTSRKPLESPQPEPEPATPAPVREPDPVRLIENNPLVTEYGDPGRTTSDDLESLRAVLRDVPNLIKDFDRYFLPENREITRFLQGHNRDRLAWLPERHPFVNGEGELVDRQGMPVFFHRLGGREFELRSGGPDARLWTADDVVVK